MKIELPSKPAFINFQVKTARTPAKGVVGFVEIEIVNDKGEAIFKVRGTSIKAIQGEDNAFFILNAPAFKTRSGYMKSFLIEDTALWKDLSQKAFQQLQELNGGLSAEECLNVAEKIDPNDIPF